MLVVLCVCFAGSASAAENDINPANDSKWAATFYGGPATNSFGTQIVRGDLTVDGVMLGFALSRHLFDLGAGFSLVGEAQIAHYILDEHFDTLSLGLGIRYGNPQGANLTIYMGPSYTINEPPYFDFPGAPPLETNFLNYASAEAVFPIANAPGWQFLIKSFHRSGFWGLYETEVDRGTMFGIGIRRNF